MKRAPVIRKTTVPATPVENGTGASSAHGGFSDCPRGGDGAWKLHSDPCLWP